MKDLINRRDAIDAIDEIESEVADGDGFQYEKWRQWFCDLPPAEPERKKGRWKGDGLGDYRCSLCGEVTRYFRTNYCPNCGADMRGGGE